MKIQVLEGCSKRFVVQLKNADGTAAAASLYEFTGGAENTKTAVDMQLVQVTADGAELLLPPISAEKELNFYDVSNRWHYQLRAVDKATRAVYVLLAGELEVIPWRGATEAAAVDVAAAVVTVQVTPVAEHVEVEAAVLPAEPLYTTATMKPAGTQEDNFDSYGFACVATQSGTVTGLTIECRVGGTARPEATPVYVKIWRGTTLVARSTNACQHALAATLSYAFEPFAVNAGDELRVTYHTAEGLAADAWQMGVQCCQRAVALTSGESGGMFDANGRFSNTAYTAKYTFHVLADRFAPAAHTADSTAHLTATEHTALAELLARKDDLLALLNS